MTSETEPMDLVKIVLKPACADHVSRLRALRAFDPARKEAHPEQPNRRETVRRFETRRGERIYAKTNAHSRPGPGRRRTRAFSVCRGRGPGRTCRTRRSR